MKKTGKANLWFPNRELVLKSEVALEELLSRISDELISEEERKGRVDLFGNVSQFDLETIGSQFYVLRKWKTESASRSSGIACPLHAWLEEEDHSVTSMRLKFEIDTWIAGLLVFSLILFVGILIFSILKTSAMPFLFIPIFLFVFGMVDYTESVRMRRIFLKRIKKLAELDILESEDITVLKRSD